jgi:phospholipid transport system transporter-binding protein
MKAGRMLTQQSPACYRLESELTFATVAALRPLGLAALAAAPGRSVVIELGAVTQADSAGLALLVDWLAAARAGAKDLRFDARAGAAE